jgi:hypothetical protein
MRRQMKNNKFNFNQVIRELKDYRIHAAKIVNETRSDTQKDRYRGMVVAYGHAIRLLEQLTSEIKNGESNVNNS